MTHNELQMLDTIETPEYLKGELDSDGKASYQSPWCSKSKTRLKQSWISRHIWCLPTQTILTVRSVSVVLFEFINYFCHFLVALPSRVHPSYPYGNPTSIKHPAARPRPPYDPTSRALFEDMGYGAGGVNGALRWRDFALDRLLPVNEEREHRDKAEKARKMATGAASNHGPAQAPRQQQHPPFADFHG
jgi:hypothetical protein